MGNLALRQLGYVDLFDVAALLIDYGCKHGAFDTRNVKSRVGGGFGREHLGL